MQRIDKIIIKTLVILLIFGLFWASYLYINREKPYIRTNLDLFGNDLVGSVVSSQKGEVYGLPWCGSMPRIKEANLAIFRAIFEAEKAGYRAMKNCRGLSFSY